MGARGLHLRARRQPKSFPAVHPAAAAAAIAIVGVRVKVRKRKRVEINWRTARPE